MLLDEVRKAVQPELEQDFDALYEEFVAETGGEDLGDFLRHLQDFGLISEGLVRRLALDPGRREGTLATPAGAPRQTAPIAWDDGEADAGEATVLARASDLIKMTEEAAAEGASSPPAAEGASGPAAATGASGPAAAGGAGSLPPPVPSPTAQPDAADRPDEAGLSEPFTISPRSDDTPTDAGERTHLALGSPGAEGPGGLSVIPTFQDDDDDEPIPTHKRTMFRKASDGRWQETDALSRKARAKPERQLRRSLPPKRQIARDTRRYTFLDATVGEGAMGKVFLAVDNILNRKIAYKEMSPEIAEQPALASKFSAEAQITAQLEHPNIVPVYALEGDVAYTMKLVRGRTVDDLIRETRTLLKKRAPLDEDHALEARIDLFLKVCDAIAYAHARGVVHRDLKPENIMVGEFGEVYVMDWGIAMLMAGTPDGPNIQDMEDEGELIIGTAGYMSPEQADARNDELTGASDQYALGLILHELLSLRPAVSGKNAVHILTRQQLGETDRLIPFGTERIPPELAAIVAKATQLQPGRRYSSVDELADDVRRHVRGEAVRARPDNPWQALVRWTGRHRQATLLAVMMVIFTSVFLVMAVGVYAQISLSRAAAREQAISGLVANVSRQASYVDGHFTRLAGLLLLISSSAEDMLTLGDSGVRRVYTVADYDSPLLRPSDVQPSSRYGIPVSAQHAAFLLAPDTPLTVQDTVLPRLVPMERHFQKVLLRSHAEDAAQYTPKRASRAIMEVGLPIAWTWVALESGAYGVFPGHGGYADGFDPRTAAWYRDAVAGTGPVWGRPTLDEDGGSIGLVMPCTTALRDSDGRLLGVAGIDVTFTHLSRELMSLEGLTEAGGTAYVLDAQGRMLIDPSADQAQVAAPPQPFYNPEVIAGIQARRTGYVEQGDDLIVYTRMASSDWYYVVRGPTNAMITKVR